MRFPQFRMPMSATRVALILVVAATSATAQNPSSGTNRPVGALAVASKPQSSLITRDDLVGELERERTNVLAYVDAVPDSAMTFRPTPGVRTFAQQVDHIVSTNVLVAQLLRPGSTYPVLGDTGAYYHTKPALRAYAVAAYEYILNTLRAAAPEDLVVARSLFGQPPAPVWKWFVMGHEHAAWTLGQTVPYLRLNRVTPPGYQLPF
ncbi:MAG: hypothetical protein NVS1B4_19520 [Gemmatimonadaceae bacterium]